MSSIVRAVFVMEQHIGHLTYYQNLRQFVEATPQIEAIWVPVTYNEPHVLWDRLSVMPARVRGALRGRSEVRKGLALAPADVVFFNTQVPAVLGGGLARRHPYLIATDLTPLQYDQLAPLYGHNPDRPGPLQIIKHRVNARVLRGAARLLPWSAWARDSLIADYGVDPGRIEVLPPGVDLTLWTARREPMAGPLRILFVGGDLRRKGGELLLRAFRKERSPYRQVSGIRLRSNITREWAAH